MAILPAILSIASRFVGKVMTTTLGWASMLLFGRVAASRQGVVVGIAFGSVLWMAMLLGILAPSAGTFLIALVPRPGFISANTMRLAMLAGAVVVPAVVGVLTASLASSPDATLTDRIRQMLRGYPLTAVMALTLVFLACLAVVRKVRSKMHHWSDEHVAIVIKPGCYDEVAADLKASLEGTALDVVDRAAPASMSVPARLLAKVAGHGADGLVPDRMVELAGPDLRILIYPSDLMISGTKVAVARARAAMASRLTTSAAHLTTSADAQAVEDRIAAVGNGAHGVDRTGRPELTAGVLDEFRAIDNELERLSLPHEEWEILYRGRLQVERDLRAGATPGEAISSTHHDDRTGMKAAPPKAAPRSTEPTGVL